MKSFLGFVFLFLSSIAYSQLAFEEITSPVDFSISAILESPGGEYFTQAVSDYNSIYTSPNGQDWTKTPLPTTHRLEDIQFFSDGTPLLKSEDDEHLIRRNGNWYTMSVTGGFYEVKASFIKDDSLFVFQDQDFAYSVDKGKTFTTVFSAAESIVDHTAHLWKLGNIFVLHHTAGASDYLTIFNEQGDLVLNAELGVTSPFFTYNSCGQVLINDENNYYLVTADGLVGYGATINLIPNISHYSDLLCQDGTYYLRTGSILYKSTGCDFYWDQLADDELISSKENMWVNHQGNIFLYDRRSDYYVEQTGGSGTWDEHPVNINYALVQSVDESASDHQIALTPNALFHKNVHDVNWMESGSTNIEIREVQYSPDGDLYINRGTDILYSADNGYTFDTIVIPTGEFPGIGYTMKVLDNDIVFLLGDVFEDCYYTLNNGKDWIPAPITINLGTPVIKLVDNYILVADLEYDYAVAKIDLGTNETTAVGLGDFFDFNYLGAVIQDDGTIYFDAFDATGGNPDGLYRYRFGEQLEFLGEFDELSNILSLVTSGNDLYGFNGTTYYLFNGTSFEAHGYSGLPGTTGKTFFISENEYVYVIVGSHRIFRSTRPLSFPQTITGKIYNDSNDDCVVDTLDGRLKNWKVKVQGEEYMRITVSDSEGKYHVSVPKGEYTVSSQPINANWDLCDDSYPVTITENNPNAQVDFKALGLADCADLELDFSTPWLRRCFDNYYAIRILNTGPEPSEGTTLTLELDPYFDFISATIPYQQVNDSIIKFDLGTLAVNDEIFFRLVFNLNCDAGLGIEHCLAGILSYDNECGNSRSSYKECQANTGAIDPNDKRVFNEAGKETDIVDKGEYIYYHIRFQNTGTDTAFNVRVVDPLSSTLDFNTIEVLSASHPYTFEINDGPALVVNFKNILLPDSTTDEAASHGFFKFRIKPLAEYDYGTSIPNQAGIYFDFNDAVNTNEAVLVILHPDGIREAKDYFEFKLYPNPATHSLTLDIPSGDVQRIDGYEIINAQGQSVYQGRLLNGKEINVANLASGIYSLVLKENGVNVRVSEFVKL